MGRISTSPIYVKEIPGPNPLSLGELGGGNEVFVTCEWVYQILMKLNI